MGNTCSSTKNTTSATDLSSNVGKEPPKVRGPDQNASATVVTQDYTGDDNTSASGSSGLVIETKTGKVPKNAPAELRVVRDWIRCKDRHDIEGMMELTDMNDCMITFVDSETEMPAREFYGAMADIFESFPNLHFFWKTMKVTKNGDDQALVNNPVNSLEGSVMIVIDDYYGIGTHTGKPYFFGPYPPVEPNGTLVRDENIEFTIWVKKIQSEDGTAEKYKIVKATVDAFGKVVGPPGFYTKIGGLII